MRRASLRCWCPNGRMQSPASSLQPLCPYAFSPLLEHAASFSLRAAWGKPPWRQNWRYLPVQVQCLTGLHHRAAREAAYGAVGWTLLQECRKSPGPTTRINPDSTFWVSSQQPCHFKLILLNVISLGHSHGYAACSSWPLAGWPAEPRRFWQRDIQPDRERRPLSLAGCFLEFLLQGNVFILWNSCSLKIKTEQEHRSSVCPLGCYVPSGKREVGAAFSRITHNEQCWYVVGTLAEESKASQCTDGTVLFLISL